MFVSGGYGYCATPCPYGLYPVGGALTGAPYPAVGGALTGAPYPAVGGALTGSPYPAVGGTFGGGL